MPDRLFGGVVAILSLLFLVIAVPSIGDEWQSGAGAQYFSVGPELFPNIAAGLTLVLGVLIFMFAPADQKLELLTESDGRRSVGAAIAIAFFFVVLLEPLGFVIAGTLALTAFLLWFGERRWFVVAPIALLVPLFVYLVFLKGFALELPAGIVPVEF